MAGGRVELQSAFLSGEDSREKLVREFYGGRVCTSRDANEQQISASMAALYRID